MLLLLHAHSDCFGLKKKNLALHVKTFSMNLVNLDPKNRPFYWLFNVFKNTSYRQQIFYCECKLNNDYKICNLMHSLFQGPIIVTKKKENYLSAVGKKLGDVCS